MTAAAAGIAFVWGLLAGSFLSLCVERLPQGYSVVRPGSRCPHCAHPLRAWDNVPLLAFLWLRGRCRYCRAAIAWRDPLLELGCGLLFAWSWVHSGGGAAFVRSAFFLSALLMLAAADLQWRQLPDEVTLGGWAVGLGFALWLRPGFVPALLTSVAAAGGLALIGIGYQRWRGRPGLGWGDIKMVGMLGAFLGPAATAVAFFLASLAASAAGLLQMLLVFSAHRRRHGWRQARSRTTAYLRHAAVPLGTFLALGGVLAWRWAPALWRLWLG